VPQNSQTIFDLRNAITRSYREFVRGFVKSAPPDIQAKVEEVFTDEEYLSPSPLVQITPAFERGRTISDLCEEGTLHPHGRYVFRSKKGESLRLHLHQEQAVRQLVPPKPGPTSNLVMVSGTGSGKSLAYWIPIVDHILRAPSFQGCCAIIVYPMGEEGNISR
jgi:ATP-dependent helicase YprA (DUF1998 family)